MPATSLDLSQIKTDALSSASAFRALIGLGTLATQSATITDYLTIASAASTYQPLDSDLTSIAALSTTAFGRGLLTEASATTARSTLGLGTLATQSPTGTPSASTFLRGDFSWQTIDLSGYLTLTGGTMTGRLQTPSILLAGNFSATAWTTNGVGLSHTARTLTDTSSTGTVATAYTNVLGGNTIAASNATTFTDYASLFLGSPSAGSNVTITNPFSLITQGAVRIGGQLSLSQGTANTSVLTSTGYSLTGSNAQSLMDLSGTWNTTGIPTLLKANVTDTASNAASLLLDLQVGGASKLRVGKLGIITPYVQLTDNPTIAAQNSSTQTIAYVGYAHSFRMGATEVPRVQVDPISGLGIGIAAGGGMNNGAWLINEGANLLAQRNSTSAQNFRIYNLFTDASNYERAKIAWESNVLRIGTEKAGTGSARALELQTDGTTRLTIGATGLFTIADALNIAVGTTTGTKIGTATNQKLGFFNATPVVQPTAVANATDAASVITQLNALLSRMRDLGLIAT